MHLAQGSLQVPAVFLRGENVEQAVLRRQVDRLVLDRQFQSVAIPNVNKRRIKPVVGLGRLLEIPLCGFAHLLNGINSNHPAGTPCEVRQL